MHEVGTLEDRHHGERAVELGRRQLGALLQDHGGDGRLEAILGGNAIADDEINAIDAAQCILDRDRRDDTVGGADDGVGVFDHPEVTVGVPPEEVGCRHPRIVPGEDFPPGQALRHRQTAARKETQ